MRRRYGDSGLSTDVGLSRDKMDSVDWQSVTMIRLFYPISISVLLSITQLNEIYVCHIPLNASNDVHWWHTCVVTENTEMNVIVHSSRRYICHVLLKANEQNVFEVSGIAIDCLVYLCWISSCDLINLLNLAAN